MSNELASIEEFAEKHKACVNALNKEKTCKTCAHQECAKENDPCASCYHIVLGLPVDPSNWVNKE